MQEEKKNAVFPARINFYSAPTYLQEVTYIIILTLLIDTNIRVLFYV